MRKRQRRAVAEHALAEVRPAEKHDHWANLDRGSLLTAFRCWRCVRWFLLLLLPVVASALAACLRGEWGEGLILLLLGVAVAAILFVFLGSGASTSNWGTFSRDRRPIRYWIDIAIWTAAYFMVSCGGYIPQSWRQLDP